MTEQRAARPGLMPPSGPIQSQHLGLWEELCELRRVLLQVRFVVNDASGWDAETRLERVREVIGG